MNKIGLSRDDNYKSNTWTHLSYSHAVWTACYSVAIMPCVTPNSGYKIGSWVSVYVIEIMIDFIGHHE